MFNAMKTLLVLSLTLAFARASSILIPNPAFELVEERSDDGSPNIMITFPNGHQDRTIMSKFYSNEEDRLARKEHCNHIGHLANDPESHIAMTGCPGLENVGLTIMSEHLLGFPMFEWHVNGTIERIENPFAEQMMRDDPAPTSIETEDGIEWHVKEGDEMVNDEIEEAEEEIEVMEEFATSAFCWFGWFGTSCGGGGGWWSPPSPPSPTSLPSSNTVQIRVGYDDNFRDRAGGNAANYLESALAHTTVLYRSPGLGTSVNLQRVGQIKHYQGKRLKADTPSLKQMYSTTQSELQGADLMVYACIGAGGVQGLAWVSTVCTNSHQNKESVNGYTNTPQGFGFVVAHEIGHNLGMSHDFDPKHGGDGGPCNRKGVMSYGSYDYRSWSDCSQKDFKAHFYNVRNQWCL